MIYQKLAEIQNELFVPKGQKNDFGKYNYRSCEDILKTVKPICQSKGCVLYLNNDLVSIGDRNYVKAEASLVELETGEKVVSVAHAREEETKKGMDGSQITGAASSYARKYALAGLFCIDNEKDSDATNQGLTKADVATIKAIIERDGIDESKVLATYKVTSLEQMTFDNFNHFMQVATKKEEAKKCKSQES